MSEMLKTALDWLSKGIAPIPILYKDKVPDGDILPLKYDEDGNLIYRANGTPKHTWEPYQKRLPSESEVKSWFSVQRNLAIVTGWQNLVVVDFDDFTAYNEWQIKSTLPATYSVLTARGVHCYYYVQEQVSNRKLDGIDIKARWGICTVPPSIHPSGVPYVALDPNMLILSVEHLDEILDVPKPSLDTEWNGTDKSKIDIWYNNDLIGAIKTRYEILDMVQGVKSSGRGWFMARCPFHKDKNPSFWIDSNRGLCGCFSGCTDKPMDVIDLYARLGGIDNESAIYEMGREIGWYEEWA